MIVYGIRCDTCGSTIIDTEYSYKYGALRNLLFRSANSGWKMIRSNIPQVYSKHYCPKCVVKDECKITEPT